MELREVIVFAIIFMAITLIISIIKSRKNRRTGYSSITSHAGFILKTGFLKIDGKRQYSIVVENTGNDVLVIKDIYLKIKSGGRSQKQKLPVSAFDPDKTLQIPVSRSGAAFVKRQDFKQLFREDAAFKIIVENSEGKTFESPLMNINLKKMEIVNT